MRLVVVTEGRHERTADGAIWTCGGSSTFWQRYLDVFDHVRVISRIQECTDPSPGSTRCDAAGVEFAEVPYYVGPIGFLRKRLKVIAAVRSAIGPGDAVIFRIGSQLAICAEPLLRRRGQPYAVEVVGDPYEVFAPGVIRHPLRPFLRWYFTEWQRRLCWRACAAAYVTERALQQRYPCRGTGVPVSDVELSSPSAFATSYSSVELLADDIAEQRLSIRARSPHVLITVASLAQRYKGVDTLVQAARLCVDWGHDIRVVVVGDGQYRESLRNRLHVTACGSERRSPVRCRKEQQSNACWTRRPSLS